MKKYILPFTLIFIGIIGALAYQFDGLETAPDGTLVEPFFQIPVRYLFLSLVIILAIIASIRSLYRKYKDS